MKTLRPLLIAALFVSLCGATLSANAADTNSVKLKPYTLKTCVVSGDKLGEMGSPIVLIYQGQEVKLCCNGCRKDFTNAPAKYIAKIRAADKQ